MGRAPCCDKTSVKRGPWSPEEDSTLKNYVEKYGTGGNWIALPQKAGLKRCGKSCRLRWLNYLRPDIKHGGFTEEEDNIILTLYNTIGSRWSVIASYLQGRTDNDVKNYWNTKLKKKLMAGKTSFGSTSETTPISNKITFDISANNSMHTINTSLPLAAPIADNETNYYENIQAFPIVDSNALASTGVKNHPYIVPEMLLSDSTQFFLPELIEVQENHTDALYGFCSITVPSPQEVPSLSPSFSLESNCASWTGNAVCQDGFFMDFAPGSSSCDILEGIDFQENYETSPKFANCAYPSFFDISNTETSGGFRY